jgi:Fe-S-cluster containining protein
MKLETDPHVVAKLAQEREDENWAFRRFLKGVDLEIEELDAIVHRHYGEVARQIDCCACANCCREVTPVLQEQDVDRLAIGLSISGEEVKEQFLTTDEDGDLVFGDHPCPLLENNRCTVYDHRPEDCCSYPHLHKEEFVFRLIQAVANCSVCPIVFNVFERLKVELWRKTDNVM